MTTEELVSKCKSAMEQGLNHVQLVLPRATTGGRRMVVFKKPRLYGEVCRENRDGHAVVFVNIIELLAWLAEYERGVAREGLCAMEVEE